MDIMVYSTNNGISFMLFMLGFLLVLLGIFWLFSGLGSKDPDIISAYKYY